MNKTSICKQNEQNEWEKGNQNKNKKNGKEKMKLLISNAFDSYGTFLEFDEVKTFGKLELSLLPQKIDTKNLVPQK